MTPARIAWCALLSSLVATAAPVQAYPDKPVRMVIGFAPGGGTDIVGRILGQQLTQAWPYPVVVDNRPGAASTIGTEIVAKAAPDGYTLEMVSMSFALNAALFSHLPYDAMKDFAHVVLVARAPNILVANPSLPVRSVKELVALARSRPGKIAYSSSGAGGVSHLSVELLRSMAGVDLLHVPYKGAGPAMTALLSGEAQLMMATAPVALAQMKAGRVRALAVSSRQRSSLAPGIPTVAESGFPEYEADTWYGLVVPARTPTAIVAGVNAGINRLLETKQAQALFAEQGAEPAGGTPDAFRAFVAAEIDRWSKVIRAAGIEAQ